MEKENVMMLEAGRHQTDGGGSTQNTKETQVAGTGFMLSPLEVMGLLEARGYSDCIVLCFDHLKVGERRVRLAPEEFRVDQIYRFEYSSDPNDQSVLYAVSAADGSVKGYFMEAYGVYQEGMSAGLLKKFCARETIESTIQIVPREMVA